MAHMEFLTVNLLNTTTQITVAAGNTATVQYLFDRNIEQGHETIGFTGNTSTVISITFTNPTVISNVLIQNHNLKQWQAWYNGSPANSLGIISNNSDTSSYLYFASVTVSSVQISLDIATDSGEKSLGELIIANREVAFERNPSVEKWKPTIFRKQIAHEMPDGGAVLFNIKDKYRSALSWDFITTSFRDTLFSIYTDGHPFYFVPFPTTSGWNGDAFESVWVGDFDFKHSSNDTVQGFSGSILLKETPSA